jgi:putative ABC transport system permease protein
MAAFGLGSLAWRTVRARPVRATLTATGIALGVAVLYAGVMTNIALERSADGAARDLLGRADLRVSAFADAGLAPDAVAAIGTVPGVAGVSPAIERRTYLAAGSGVGVGVDQATLPPPVTVLGIDPADAVAHDIPIAAGAPLGDGDGPSALISERLARETGLMLGDEIAINGAGDARPEDLRFRIVGLVAGDGPLPDAGGRTIVVPLDRAQAAFRPTGLSRVDVVLGPGASVESVSAGLASRIGQPYLVSSRAAVVQSLQASTTEFGTTTALVAAVALFAGAFLIFNTLSMTVAERVRDVGLLRAAGATRRQVVGVVLAVAAILGTIGSLAGVALGAVLASLLTTSAAELAGLRTVDLSPAPAAVAIALVSGLAVTIAAAVEPAIRASRIAPVEALKPQIGSGVATAARIRWLVAVFAAVGLVGLLLWPAGATVGMVLPGAAAYGVLLVVALAVPWLVAPLGRLAGIPFGAIFRAEERFVRGSLARDRSRAALTVGALAIALAAVVALGGVASDARGSAESWIAGVVPGDVLATSVTPRALDDGDRARARGIPVGRTRHPDRDVRRRVPRTSARHGGRRRIGPSGRRTARVRRRRPDGGAPIRRRHGHGHRSARTCRATRASPRRLPRLPDSRRADGHPAARGDRGAVDSGPHGRDRPGRLA